MEIRLSCCFFVCLMFISMPGLGEEEIKFDNEYTVNRQLDIVPYRLIPRIQKELDLLKIQNHEVDSFYSSVANALEEILVGVDHKDEETIAKEVCANGEKGSRSYWVNSCAQTLAYRLVKSIRPNLILREFGYAEVKVAGVYTKAKRSNYHGLIITQCGDVVGLLNNKLESVYDYGDSVSVRGLLSPENNYSSREAATRINYQFLVEEEIDK